MKALLIISVFCLAVIFNVSGQETPQEMLNKAIYEEEVNGNLEEAMKLFLEIVDENSTNRAVTAEAFYHLGLTNEKLGNKKAIGYYEKVVNNFEDQPEFVRIAKERLNRIVLLAEKELKIPLEPTFTKIQIPVKLARGAQLSPDGKTLTFSSTRYEGSIWTIPIPGKVGPDIAGKPEKLIGEDKVWSWGHVWSADGKWIAYNYMKNDKEKDIFVDEVHVITSTGGEPTKIALPVNRGGSYHLFQYSLSLSPDGKVLAYASKEEGKSDKPKESYIYTIPVNGGVAKRLTDGNTWLPAFSPNGNKIAYMKISAEEDGLWVIPALGGTPVKVSDLGGKAWGPPIWSPDGDIIAFLREPKSDGECKEILLVPLSETGKPSAPPKRIELSLEASLNLAGWTNDNKIGIFMLSPELQAIYTIPSMGGKATQVTPADGLAFSASWSPDGKRIYLTYNDKLSSISTEGGKISAIPINGMDSKNWVNVSPDGKKLLFTGTKEGVAGIHIWTVPIEGGKPIQVTLSPLYDSYPCWSPDGKIISFWRQEMTTDGNSVKTSLCLISAEGSDVRVLVTDADKLKSGPNSMCWSSDSKSIVYYCYEDGKIKTVPVDNGEPKVLADLHKGDQDTWITFSPDGKKILYTANKKIWTISLDGGEPVEIETGLDTQPVNLTWAPDGEKIAFTTRKGGEIDLWLMENFLPLEKLPQKKEKEKKNFVIRKVIDGSGSEFEAGSPSPDGKHFAFTDWDTGNLAIYESTAGKKRLLTKEGSWESNQMRYTENSTWSPDGNQLVYNWWIDDDLTELRIIGLDDLKPRILYKNEEVLFAQTFDWSADGKQILACFQRKDNSRQIVLVSTENGSVRVLKTLVGKIWMNNMSFSPDGRYIVYDLPPEEFSKNPDIFLMPTSGGHEISLVKHPAYDKVLGWAPDGKNILFASDRTGTFDAFVIQVTEGKPQGNPKLIKSDIGNLTPRGFTQKGSFYYSTSKGGNNVYTAGLDPETGKILAPPKMAIKRFEGSNYYPYYSPDGKYIVYISGRNGQGIICIRNLETNEDKEFYLEGHNIKGARNFRWSSDCSSILVKGIDNKNRYGIFRINVQSGNFTPVIPWESWKSTYLHSIELSRDGKAVFYVDFNTSNKISQILVRDIDTGIEKELYRFDTYINMSLSPDGKWLASSHPKSLKVMPASGGDPRELYTFKEEYNLGRPITWSADGKYILFSDKEPGQDGWELCRIPVEGGELQKLGLEMEKGFNNLSAHPNGRHIAFSAKEQKNVEFWVMENFLPETEIKK